MYLKIGEMLSEFIQNNEDGDLVSSKYIQKLDGTCYSWLSYIGVSLISQSGSAPIAPILFQPKLSSSTFRYNGDAYILELCNGFE